MPTLPIVQQQTRISGAGDGPGPVGADGLQALGQAIGHVADSIELVQRRDAANEAANALADLRVKSTQRLVESQATANPDASGYTDGVMKGFADDVRDAAAAVKSPLAKRAIRDRSLELREDIARRAIVWEAGQRDAYRKDSALQSADKTRVALELDPTQWGKAGAEQMAAIDALGLPPSERLELKRHVDETLTEGAAVGVAKQAPLDALDRLKTAASGDPRFDGLTAVSRKRVEALARSQVVEQATSNIAAAYDKGGPDGGLNALHTVLSDKRIPDDLKADIRAKAAADVSQVRSQKLEEHAGDLRAIDGAIATDTAGTRTHTAVDSLYNLGALTPQQQASMHAQIDASMIQSAGKLAKMAEFNAAMAAGLPLDPKDPDQRKALDAVFASDTVGQQPGSPGWQANAQAWAQRARMLPPAAVSWTRAALRSPSDELAARAAQFYGGVAAAVPDAVSEFDPDTKAFGEMVNSMMESGTPAASAVQTARASVFEVPKAARDQREHAWKGAGRDSLVGGQAGALSQYMDRDFDPGWFTSEPAQSDPRVARAAGARMLQPDFDAQSERYFLKTGDANIARELAWRDVKAIYGPSKVNGPPTMMAFPPERFGVTPEEVRGELTSFVGQNPQPDGSTAADLVLVPDALTMRQVGDALNGQEVQPSYAVVGKSGDVVQDRNGVRLRYTVPDGQELGRRIREAQAKAMAEAQQRVDEARAERKKRDAERAAFAEMVRSGVLPTTSD